MIPENKIQSHKESFAITNQLDLEQVEAGVVEAMNVYEAFVAHLSPKQLDPKNFGRVMAKNPAFIYSLIESVSTALVNEAISLREQLRDTHHMMDQQRIAQLEELSKISKALVVVRFKLDSDEAADVVAVAADEDEDLPYWKVTVLLPSGDKVTHILDHVETSQYFHHARVVAEDPHPEYDAADSFDQPADDADFIDDDTL